MQREIIELLCCPECGHALTISRTLEKINVDGLEFIRTGLLRCIACEAKYPIIERIPRLVRTENLTDEETEKQKLCENFLSQDTKIAIERPVEESRKYQIIREKVIERLKPKSLKSEKLRKRLEHDIEYRILHTEKKDKLIKTCLPYLKKNPETIVEIGGGQGGTIDCFSRYFGPRISISLDMDPNWMEISIIRNPFVNAIRADATNLPLKTQSVDLVLTTSTLEHIKDWRTVTREIARVGRNALVGYGPNKWFFYDWGHLDAPFVTFLPKAMSAPVAYFFHWARKTGRSYKSIRNELNRTYYISRNEVTRALEKYGTVKNVFSDFLYHSVYSDYHYVGGKFKQFLKAHPMVLRVLAFLLVMFRIEPIIYIFFTSGRRQK